MAGGDHFFVWRQHNGVPFQHHGIDLGDGTAVHFTDGLGGVAGPGGRSSQFEVRRTDLSSVTRNGRDRLHVVEYDQRFGAETVVRRAISQVGRRGYHLIYDNCEHFACWCVVGSEESRQVNSACERLGATGVKAIVVSSVRTAGKLGTRHLVRGVSPWVLMADAAQWITEAGGHHLGLRNPQRRKHAGRAVGMVTSLGVGACGGPAGMLLAGGVWATGELAGEISRASYLRMRQQRRSNA